MSQIWPPSRLSAETSSCYWWCGHCFQFLSFLTYVTRLTQVTVNITLLWWHVCTACQKAENASLNSHSWCPTILGAPPPWPEPAMKRSTVRPWRLAGARAPPLWSILNNASSPEIPHHLCYANCQWSRSPSLIPFLLIQQSPIIHQDLI